MICPKCGTEMLLGKAIKPDMEANALYICRPPMINSETLELINVLKCPVCGHSEELNNERTN